MIANYLKIALRNLNRHKGYTIISVSGLALGLACCLTLLLYIQHELSYDTYHHNNNRIYRLVTDVEGSSYGSIAKVHGPWGPTALSELPEVESMTRFVFANQTLFTVGELKAYENNGFITDSTVFHLFDFKIINGDASSALTRPDGIVITESLAQKYFNNQNPLGKTITLNNELEAEVTAVIEDVPTNSHFTFTFLLPMSGYNHPDKASWRLWNQFYTYLLLKDGASPTVVSNKFKDLLPSYLEAEVAESYIPYLQSLTSIHLGSHLFREIEANSDITYLYVFGAIGVLILFISSINFINLTTARALTRMKEVGIRKTSGAARSQLIIQYLSEALIISYISLALGFLLFYVFLPSFNTLTGKTLSLLANGNNLFYGLAFFATTITGLLSGSYPAFYLASQKPSEVLKGKTKTSGSNTIRKALVIIQFAISAFLIISAAIIFQQLSYIQSKKLGFNPSELITIPIQDNVMRDKAEVIKSELLGSPEIEGVTVSGGLPGGNDWGIPLVIEGIDTDQIPPMRVLAVGHDFINTFQMEIASGRDFSKDYASDTIAYIINEEAARQLGWQNPLDHRISMPAVGRPPGSVIGVIKDFHFRSLKEKIAPVVLFIPPASWSSYYTIRIKTDRMQAGLNAVENIWNQFDTTHPFTYTFFDETYGRMYDAENRLGTLVAYFTFIGIFIACLGLFSLSSFMAAQRTKEIGIRKVMGASVKSITVMLTKELILLVLLGFIVAVPVGYYIMQQWLGDFAYRVSIRPEIFVITALVTLTIAIITVSFKVIRASSKNPVEALRAE